MPQLTLNAATIADVLQDPNDPSKRIVRLNVNEEDFFEMLDHVNPKNIVKYLDMRGIQHREALQIKVRPIEVDSLPDKHSPEYGKAIKRLRTVIKNNDKKLERIDQLEKNYPGRKTRINDER